MARVFFQSLPHKKQVSAFRGKPLFAPGFPLSLTLNVEPPEPVNGYRILGLGSNIGHGLFVGWVWHPDIFCWVSFLYPTYLPAIFLAVSETQQNG